MGEKFSAKIRNGSDYTYIQIRGVIDEDNQLTSLLERVSGRVVILDLSAVDRINSCGVRDWVNWLGEVESKVDEIIMIRCSPAIVGQANMVTNFLGNAIVHSFYAPYYSPVSEVSVDKLLRVDQFPPGQPITAPAFLCEDSGQPMDFDDFEESYFAFLSAMDRSRVSERVQRLVEEVSPDLEKKIQQLNEGSLSQLTGPVNTAVLMTPPPAHTPDGLGQLISTASEARDASAPDTSAPDSSSPDSSDASTPSTDKSSSNPMLSYALIGVAVIIVLVLVILVATT